MKSYLEDLKALSPMKGPNNRIIEENEEDNSEDEASNKNTSSSNFKRKSAISNVTNNSSLTVRGNSNLYNTNTDLNPS
jgi:hypothetical protein